MKLNMAILNGLLLALLFSLTGCFSLSFLNDDGAGKAEANLEFDALDATPSSKVRTTSDLKSLKPMVFEESIHISAPDTTQSL
ncbi:MAG: hypothetical protein ACJZ85_01250 [Pontiellaceae bacterium]